MITNPQPPPVAPPETSRKTAAYLRLCGLGPADADRCGRRSIEELLAQFDAWAATLVPAQPGESPAQHCARGRAQLLLAGVPSRWPDEFLRANPTPELAGAVQSATLQPLRPLHQTTMTPEPLDLGPVSEVADETWKTFDKWPVLRGLTIWLLFLLLLSSVFYLVRF
jgi:hypothetical protein